MDKRFYSTTITVYDRDAAYSKVGNILHEFAQTIQLRVGYPVPEKNVAVIFLMIQMTNDEMGTLSGRLGQIESVKVKSNVLNV